MKAWVGAFLGLAGVACGLTLVFRSMRSVMEIGGSCADGGPYVSAQPCPDGVVEMMLLGIFGGLVALLVFGLSAARLGPGYAGLALWAWPGLFLSLGWNFWEYGLDPPGGGGTEAGWIVCGVLFVLMGGLPLIYLVRTLPSTLWPPDAPDAGTPGPLAGFALTPAAAAPAPVLGMSRVSAAPPPPPEPVFDGTPPAAPAVPNALDVVTRLERLLAMKQRGELTEAEYEQAKKAVLAGD